MRIPKAVFQFIAVALLLAALISSVQWAIQGSGPTGWLIDRGWASGVAALLGFGVALGAWFAVAIPLRLMTDFGEPLIQTRESLHAALQKLDEAPVNRDRQLAIGGFATAGLAGAVAGVLWLLELGIHLGALVLVGMGVVLGSWHLVRSFR